MTKGHDPPATGSATPSNYSSSKSSLTVFFLLGLIGAVVLDLHALYFTNSMFLSASGCDDSSRSLLTSKSIINLSGVKRKKKSQEETKRLLFNSPTKFVFTIGLEGTGHHLMEQILKHSPFLRQLEEWDKLGFDSHLYDLGTSLYQNEDNYKGLWSAHCKLPEHKLEQPLNDQVLLDRVVGHMRAINDKVNLNIKARNTTIIPPLTTNQVVVPVNAIRVASSEKGSGMVSYPNFADNCRSLNFPNIDLFYKACDEAQVDCEHVYLYRDSYDIIASTSIKRIFNLDPLIAIQLYIAHLSVIYTQFMLHPSRTVGCSGFYDANISIEGTFAPIRDLFGWKEQPEQFNKMLNTVYKPPIPLTKQERLKTVPPKYAKYMKSMEKYSNEVIAVCRAQAAANTNNNNNEKLLFE